MLDKMIYLMQYSIVKMLMSLIFDINLMKMKYK